MSGTSSAGAGCFTYRVSRLWTSWRWGHWDDDVGDDAVVSACRGFCSVLGLLQTVQRAELWGGILALQANDGVHLGVDNLDVVRHVGRILDGRVSSRPRELLPDGDPLLLFERMLHFREMNIVRTSKVKGHADEALVRAGAVRYLDPVVLSLHRFFIAISRAVVNHDGGVGTSVDPMVGSAGRPPMKRRVAVRDRAF